MAHVHLWLTLHHMSDTQITRYDLFQTQEINLNFRSTNQFKITNNPKISNEGVHLLLNKAESAVIVVSYLFSDLLE